KNRTLDSDGRKVFEEMFAGLFKNHNYGLQTTIGTIEHLKNPSLVEIRKYYNTYYVPNNMGVIMVGDFDSNTMIKKIDQAFSYMQKSDLKPYSFEPEKPIETPIVRKVVGPESESVMIGYRFPGSSSRDAQMLELMSSILSNGSAGLIDLNLVKQQKLLGAYAFPYVLRDYGVLLISGSPTEGQSTEEVKELLLKEIENIKNGNFSEEIITSISNNIKKSNINTYDSFTRSASVLMDHFTSESDWANTLAFSDHITSVSKQDIMDFAKKYLKDNYVVVYKEQGKDENTTKVDKPQITAVEVNREAESDFLGYISNIPETPVAPVWLDYKKDIDQSTLGNYPLLSVQNKNNDLFSLYYHFNTGSYANKLWPVAANYIRFVGTHDKTADEITQAFYALATNFSVSTQGEESYISLSGLQENFDASVRLLHDLIENAQADDAALEAYVARLKRSRENSKKDKGAIQRGLMNYAQYGADNPFNYGLTDEELDNLTAEELLASLKELMSYQFKILYYGPKTNKEIGKQLSSLINTKGKVKSAPKTKEFVQREIKNNEVYFADYDMVQVEVTFYRNAGDYNAQEVPNIRLFNEYFGGGMGSIVFQTIRESKALAYSTYAGLSTASRLNRQNTFSAYVGAQNDKFESAVEAMHELLDEFPESNRAFGNAKDAMQKKLVTDRINDASILFSYLNAERLGLDYDIRKTTYESLANLELSDLNKLHANLIQKKPYAYCIITDEENISEEQLNSLGELKRLSLEEIFGY
ncbi:MAG TPA: insulinase family protein, partial [Flavobacteriaceae bacterium]|nr:insulinase family protein [Flavobacteriaceae bacterium]